MTFFRATVLTAASLAAVAVPASADHWWGGYHWATMGTGLDVKVNSALTSSGGWSSTVGAAVSDWEVSTALTLGAVQVSSASAKRCNPIVGEILVCNEFYGQRGWLGIASIWNDSKGHIAQATTKLNDSYFATGKYNTPAWRSLVACQEIGHDFGLDHQDETFLNYNLGTCMDYTNAPEGGVVNGFNYGPGNRDPNTHDYDELKTIYRSSSSNDTYTSAHPTASSTYAVRYFGKAPPPSPSAAPIGDSPAEWGRAIHRDSAGRPDEFVKDLGNGQKVITHVFWALETKVADIS